MSISSREWHEIRQMVAQMATVILSGEVAATNVDGVVGSESINNMYPGAPTIEGRPIAHPYGLVSRAPAGTTQVTARQGEHPANRLVLLHRDKHRPAVGDGDVWLYDNHGNQVKLEQGKIVMKLAGNLELGEGSTKGVARVQDPITLSSGATLVGTLTAAGPPGPVVSPATVTIVLSAPAVSAGTIAQGSTKVTCAD